MCGRFAQSQPAIRYAHALDPAWTPEPLDLKPSWNAAPSQQLLVFHDGEGGHVAELFTWGFLPDWAHPDVMEKCMNAKVETAGTKPYFRKAWKAGRCLVPADGWYEWIDTPKGKQPYFIHRADGQPIMMAGLYEANPYAQATTFAIITMESSGDLRKIHEREPLVLSANAGLQWIRRDLAPVEIAKLVQHPLTSKDFAWYTVSTKVNSTKTEGAELIVEVPSTQQQNNRIPQ